MEFSLKENPPKESISFQDFQRQIHNLLGSASDPFEVVKALDRILREWISPEFIALTRQLVPPEMEWVYARYKDDNVSMPAVNLKIPFRDRLIQAGCVLNLDKRRFFSFFEPSIQSEFLNEHYFSLFPIRAGGDFKGLLLLGTSSPKHLDQHTVNTLKLLSCHLGALLHLSEARGKLVSKTRQLEIVLDHASEGINIIDSRHNLRYANAWTQRKFALQPSAQKCYHAFFGAEEPCHGCPISTRSATERSILRANGRDTFSMFLHPLSGGKKAEFFIEIMGDKTLTTRCDEVTAERNRLNSIVEFARAVGHELNQPLTGISGYCALIKEEVDDSSAIYRDVAEIEKQAARLERIVVKFQHVAHLDYSENIENGIEQGSDG